MKHKRGSPNSRKKKTVKSSMDRGGPLAKLRESALKGELVVVFGAGISIALTNSTIPALNWKGLISDGFRFGQVKGIISPIQVESWRSQIDSQDVDDLLSAAEFVSRKLSTNDLYSRWLEEVFKDIQISNRNLKEVLLALHHAKIPFCTLNYDHLLEAAVGIQPITLAEPKKCVAWMRREIPGILHLHGAWDSPSTCILGIRDYETTLTNDLRDLIQRSLGSFKRLLFIGCGDTFNDPNFTALIKWLKDKMKTAALQHYALVTNDEVSAKHADPAWRHFVEPIGYGPKHNNLSDFLKKHLNLSIKHYVIKSGVNNLSQNDGLQSSVLKDYCSFLIKDCGQMTIEGVRADMEIGQRRFDLERLFVPLKIQPCPPELSRTDPQAEQKLRKWEEQNNRPISFGQVFKKHKHLALLALPGGGKTLLLKRLAVAYADAKRLQSTEDSLPTLDLLPVLIRCREWRDHIRKPILTLLESVPEITGQPALAGLKDALLPLLPRGKVLLLIDGLDEIHVDADRTTFVDHLESFLEDFPNIRMVVTSREAGFSLVAPSLSRFCERWRVAPLEEAAIKLLCENWQSLMSGDSPEAKSEIKDVVDHLIQNPSLRRLAENPLLLTMLLVVKHGAGRLPPDRVSLYSRAVEVLLDTWNIKGHDPLNLKEAVPQLACVAFQLMKAGKQTATEKELLKLLEEAREKVPQIHRYAKDTPYDFLKRVELRSSLLLEAGHQIEGGATVPFYQFRHLTFQEYLAAVAIAEGHYVEYSTKDTILTPLEKSLTADEWKEVVPMTAVLARKQAEPLMRELLIQGQALRQKFEQGEAIEPEPQLIGSERLAPPISRLLQCLVEEAEATPRTTTEALQLISFFAKGCYTQEDWRALSRGPYGAELLYHSRSLFCSPQIKNLEPLHTCAYVAAARFGNMISSGGSIATELHGWLTSSENEDILHGLFIIAGKINDKARRGLTGAENPAPPNKLVRCVAKHLHSDSFPIRRAALWVWALASFYYSIKGHPTIADLDHILKLWLTSSDDLTVNTASTALWTQLGLNRQAWKPNLKASEIEQIRDVINAAHDNPHDSKVAASLMVAFHAKTVLSDKELIRFMTRLGKNGYAHRPNRNDILETMIRQLKNPKTR